MKTEVAIGKCSSYRQQEVDRAVVECIDRLGGIHKFVRPGQRILLKINQLMGKSMEHAVTTHPAVLRAMIRLVRDAKASPYVGDSPAIASLDSVAEKSGIKEVCDDMGVQLVELDEPVTVKNNSARLIRSFRVSGKLEQFDAIINMPKLKTHSLTGMTGAVKNLFGCVPGRLKQGYHLRLQDGIHFSEMLLDLGRIIKPVLNIMDAVVAMEGQGPAAGTPRKLGLLIAGRSALAVDTVAVHIIGMKDTWALTILAAKRQGMAEADIKNISVIGEDIPRIKSFRRPKSFVNKVPLPVMRTAKSLFTARPALSPELCIGCGHCMEICPAHAIKIIDKKPVFDYSRCIRCYCCHEVCPQKAIRLKSGLLAKAAEKITGQA